MAFGQVYGRCALDRPTVGHRAMHDLHSPDSSDAMISLTRIGITLGAAFACAAAPSLSAQHVVNYGGSWVHNFTILAPPQSNTNTQTNGTDTAFATARTDYYIAAIHGFAKDSGAGALSTSSSAVGSGQGSYTFIGKPNGTAFTQGELGSSGSVARAGDTSGSSFSANSSYSNSIGISKSVSVVWNGAGSVLQVPTQTFDSGGLALALDFDWESSTSSSLAVSASGVGARILVLGSASIETETWLN